LREYVRAQPSRQSDETLTQYLRRVGVDDSPPTGGPATPTEEQSNAHTQPMAATREQDRARLAQQRAAKEAQIAAADEARKREAQNSILIGKGVYAAGIIPNKAADTIERIQNWIATRPTPGGNGALLLILLIFVAFIVPVAAGGYTRAQLF